MITEALTDAVHGLLMLGITAPVAGLSGLIILMILATKDKR